MNRTCGIEQRVADPETIRKELENGLKNPNPKTPLGRAIKAKKTIRFGNKADPYQPIEKVTGVTHLTFDSYSYSANSRGRRKALSLALRNLNARLENCQLVPWEKSRDEKPTQDYLADWAWKKGDGVFDQDRMVEAVLGELPPGHRLQHDPFSEG